jgi:hypothetical protein
MTLRYAKGPPSLCARLRKQYRLGASVPPVYASRNPADARSWQGRLIESFRTRQPVRFNLLTEDPEALEAICREMKLELVKLVDPRARIDYGKLSPADLSFNALLVHHEEGIELRVHLVDTETGTRHGYADIYVDEDDHDPERRLEGLIGKIERHYPVLTGRVVGLTGGRARLSLGAASGLMPWGRFLVVQPGPDGSLDGGRLRKQAAGCLEVRVSKVGDRTSEGLLERSGLEEGIAEGDYVYAR